MNSVRRIIITVLANGYVVESVRQESCHLELLKAEVAKSIDEAVATIERHLETEKMERPA